MSKGMRPFIGILGTVWCVSILWSVTVGLGLLVRPEVPVETPSDGFSFSMTT